MMLALLLVLLMTTLLLALLVWKSTLSPWLPGHRQWRSPNDFCAPGATATHPSLRGQLDCTEQISHVRISLSKNYYNNCIDLILFQVKKSARVITNHFLQFVCLQHLSLLLMLAHVHFLFTLFFFFVLFFFSVTERVRVCARNCNYALQWVALFPFALKLLLYVVYWQKNENKLKQVRTIHFQTIDECHLYFRSRKYSHNSLSQH